jgi:hypothetical protein
MMLTNKLMPHNPAETFTYLQYGALIEELVAENRTTGPNQSVAMVAYTKLNYHRMQRLDKTIQLLPEITEVLESLSRSLFWLVITEPWCGDAAQNVPVLAKIAAAAAGKITLELVLRDENHVLMDEYLTNGTRSIPKLICFDAATGQELGTWGPRPAAAQELLAAYKANPQEVTKEQFINSIQVWYSKDKTQSMQQELWQLLQSWK